MTRLQKRIKGSFLPSVANGKAAFRRQIVCCLHPSDDPDQPVRVSGPILTEGPGVTNHFLYQRAAVALSNNGRLVAKVDWNYGLGYFYGDLVGNLQPSDLADIMDDFPLAVKVDYVI